MYIYIHTYIYMKALNPATSVQGFAGWSHPKQDALTNTPIENTSPLQAVLCLWLFSLFPAQALRPATMQVVLPTSRCRDRGEAQVGSEESLEKLEASMLRNCSSARGSPRNRGPSGRSFSTTASAFQRICQSTWPDTFIEQLWISSSRNDPCGESGS